MPPTSQPQGSRAGLISALVVLAILFVAATALFIVEISKRSKAEQDVVDLTARYTDLLPDGSPSSTFADDLRTAAKNTQFAGAKDRSAAEVAALARTELARKITGDSSSFDDAMNRANATLAAAAKTADGAPLPSDLIGAMSKLATLSADAKTAAETAVKAADNANKQMQTRLLAVAEELKKKDEQIKVLQDQVAGEIAKTTTDRGVKDVQIKDIQEANRKQAEALQETINKQQVDIAAKITEVAIAKKENDILRGKLASFKLDPKIPISSQADALITQITAGDTVYINIGQGEQVSPGLTFEVHSKTDGIPKLSDPNSDENLPIGKASIEVVRVGASSSECRIVRRSPGTMGLAVGDVCVNIVYDRNARMKFYVHGKFDLDQNGVATDQDAEVVKKLIAQWGGQAVDKIDINTDFVVMGVEPKVPELKEEDKDNVLLVAAVARATEELKKYQGDLDRATDLHIPILNQNRFLYFVGFFAQAKK